MIKQHPRIKGLILFALLDVACVGLGMGVPLLCIGLMLLFEPRPSFIAWLALMVVISPFLQFLMALLGSCVTLAWRSNETHAHA